MSDLTKEAWKLVPMEPTPKMIANALLADDCRTGGETCAHLYRAMLAAAPSPAQEPDTMFGITGATSAQEALAVALFNHRCPGLLMQDEDFPHYEAAAKLALSYHDDPSEAPPTQEQVPWQSIKTAPRDGTEVDLWCRSPGFSGGGYARIPDCWFSDGKWWRYDANGDDQCRERVHNATHWMPRPPPPSAQEPVWLIEWPDDGNLHPLRWWHGEFGYTRDPNKTPRFARREDAEMAIKYLKLVGAKAVEHMWMDDKVTRLALSASPSPAQEPVAWLYQSEQHIAGDSKRNEWVDVLSLKAPPNSSFVRAVKPLYAHPSPSPSLTKAREALEALITLATETIDANTTGGGMERDNYRSCVIELRSKARIANTALAALEAKHE